MPRPLVVLLAGALGAPPPAPSSPPADAPVEGREFVGADAVDATPDAETLYKQGEQAYWLGDFNLAVDRFEAAYAASRLPALLYNVGLAYLRRHELSRDARDLHRAGAVLRNYAIELEKDPSLGQADNVPKLLAQIDQLLAAESSAPVQSQPEGPAACPELPPPAPPPPARSGRPAAALMATGGLLLAGGVASTLAFALKGRGFTQQLAGLRAEQADAGCSDMSSATCDYLAEAAQITVDNGRRANLLAGGLGGGLTALGAAGLVVGAVLYPRERPPPERAHLRAAPTAGGLVLHGRF